MSCGILRSVDIVFIQRKADGNVLTLELNGLEPELHETFAPAGEQLSSLFKNGDLQIAASRLPQKSAAMVISHVS